jgi:hypothetical protein
MFRDAAINLPDYSNGAQFWPKYALLTHAIELALKAFARHSVATGKPAGTEPANHDLVGWYELALQYDLQDDLNILENIRILNELHSSHFSRYPQNRSAPLPDASAIADVTVDHLIGIVTRLINPR